jgi:hypothetical protein
MATLLENEFSTEPQYFQTNFYREILKKFRNISSFFVHFHLSFAAILCVEIAVLFSTFIQTVYFAILASVFVATCFTYLVLLFYYQARKPEKLKCLTEEFLNSCRLSMNDQHLSIAEALTRLCSYLEGFEWEIYKTSSPFLSRFSAYCYWEDVFKTKQMLLLASIREHFQQIRLTPTDLEVHASLGSTYVALSKLYRQPIQNTQHPRISQLKKIQSQYEEKSKKFSRLAIEEFKIISHYASEDPWIHEQMALGFKDLDLPMEETKEIETLLRLRPQDKEILSRLGTLYFKQGMNAKGLIVYEELKKTNFKKAEELIASYGQV